MLPFPSQEVDPYRGLAPHLEVASARARALHALATRSARLVVASARALLPKLGEPGARWPTAGITLYPGLEISPQDLGDGSRSPGSRREDPVDEHGEFVVRGGVVDIYPASEAQPVRLEFIGDIVESLRRYDAATQRSLAALDRLVDQPAARSAACADDLRRRSSTTCARRRAGHGVRAGGRRRARPPARGAVARQRRGHDGARPRRAGVRDDRRVRGARSSRGWPRRAR